MLNILKRPRESLGSENGSQLSQPDCSPHRQAMLECSPGAGGKRLRAQSSGDAMSTPTSQFLAAVDSGERPTPAKPALAPGAAPRVALQLAARRENNLRANPLSPVPRLAHAPFAARRCELVAAAAPCRHQRAAAPARRPAHGRGPLHPRLGEGHSAPRSRRKGAQPPRAVRPHSAAEAPGCARTHYPCPPPASPRRRQSTSPPRTAPRSTRATEALPFCSRSLAHPPRPPLFCRAISGLCQIQRGLHLALAQVERPRLRLVKPLRPQPPQPPRHLPRARCCAGAPGTEFCTACFCARLGGPPGRAMALWLDHGKECLWAAENDGLRSTYNAMMG